MFTQNHRHSHSIITVEMTNQEVLSVMSEGKPAAWSLFAEIEKKYDRFELLCMLYILDQVGVYGSYIPKLYFGLCEKDVVAFHDLIFALQTSTDSIISVKKYLHLI